MWRTPLGIRTLKGAEAALFRRAFAAVVDVVFKAHPETEFSFELFDDLTQGQRMAALLLIGCGLLCDEEPPSEPTAVLEAAIATVYVEIMVALVQELDRSEQVRERPGWRELILRACREAGVSIPGGLPRPQSTDLSKWQLLTQYLSGRVVCGPDDEDADLEIADLRDPYAAEYFTAIPEPDERELPALRARLQNLARPGPASLPGKASSTFLVSPGMPGAQEMVEPPESPVQPTCGGDPGQPDRGSWRDVALTWVRAACIGRDVERDVARLLDDAAGRGLNCSFTLGPRLTRKGRAYLVHCHEGEVFVFELTASQVRRLGLQENMMVQDIQAPRPQAPPPRVPRVLLERLEIDREDRLKETDPITGRCVYRLSPAAGHVVDPADRYALRLDYWRGRVCVGNWCYLQGPLTESDGVIPFSFTGMRRPDEPEYRHFRGPLAVFVRLWIVHDPREPEKGRPVSDLCAGLIDVG